MDKVVSTRMDEAVAQTRDGRAATLRRPRKRIVEDAIGPSSRTSEAAPDPMELSFGAWKRDESAEELHRRARAIFEASFRRHQG